MLSGDDMICYLLFPEVLFHYIDKMEKARLEGVQRILLARTQCFSIYFFKLFPLLFLCLSCFSFLLLCSCLRHNQSFVAEAYRSGQFGRETLLRAVCLLPRAVVGDPVGEKEHPGKPS